MFRSAAVLAGSFSSITTSGSPLITGYNPATGTGTIVGVIGGYQLGGDTRWVSYSPYFNRHVWTLYQQAIGG